ncbi:lasso RiPP family leader peptide-containing protein [Protofrankia symbiont of Coriaria ruscifolia]|nr:lasso RiPP family leader peptide-containing protein [Protofrankia symbiont of Coriaria ruscifolia]
MRAPYQAPALQEVGAFSAVTEGHYYGYRRDYYGRRRRRGGYGGHDHY